MERKFYSQPNLSLREKIPIPPRKPLPLEDVPMWSQLPYDTKYPLSECSKTAVTLTREELGKSLYQTFPRKEFDLSMSPIPYPETASYDSLHDPQLRRYLLSPFRYKQLVTRGLVTEDGKVKSHVQHYNHYRMYLYHLWAMEVNQLRRNQISEERRCFEALLSARKSENNLFKKIAGKYDKINIDEILEDAATEIFQNKKIIDEHGFGPFVRAIIRWKIHEENLQKDYRKHYPAIKQWLCDKTKHYKRFMEIKLNAGRNRDKKLRSRWEKICESSRARLERATKLKELEKERKKILTEQRYNRVKRLWAENDRALKQRKKKKTTDLSKSFTYEDSDESESKPADKTSEPYKLQVDIDDDQDTKRRFPGKVESRVEKISIVSPKISKSDREYKEFEDDMEIMKIDFQLEDKNEFFKMMDREIKFKRPPKEELLKQIDSHTEEVSETSEKYVHEIPEDMKIKGILKVQESEENEKETTLQDQNKDSFYEWIDDIADVSVQKIKPHLDLVDQSKLMKFLYGLPEATKQKKKEIKDYSPIIEETEKITGEEKSRDHEIVEKFDDSTSNSFKTPLEKILAGYGYEENGDVWKALENLHQEKLRKYHDRLGLDEEKIKQWKKEKMRKELHGRERYSSPTIQPMQKKKYPTVQTSDESIKIYKTDSKSDFSEDESKENIMRRIFIKKKTGMNLMDFEFIKNKYKVRKEEKLKNKLEELEISPKITSTKSEIIKIGYNESDIYKYKKQMLDVELYDSLISGSKAHFTKKGILEINNLYDTRIRDLKLEGKYVTQRTETTPDFTSSYLTKKESDFQLPYKKKIADLPSPHPIVCKLQEEKKLSSHISSYMQSKDYQIHKIASNGKKDSKPLQKYLAALLDDIISEVEIPKIQKRQAEIDDIENITNALNHELDSDIKLTQTSKENIQDTKLRFDIDKRDVTTFDSKNSVEPSSTTRIDSLKFRNHCHDESKYNLLEKTDAIDEYFTIDPKYKDVKSKDEFIEKDKQERNIEEIKPSNLFLSRDIHDEKIVDDTTSICSNVVKIETSDDLFAKTEIESLQEMIHTYIQLKVLAPSDPMNLLYNLDALHKIKKEEIYDSINRKKNYNYLSAKSVEYFGYIDEIFQTEDLVENKETKKFWEFLMTGRKHLIPQSDVKSVDITHISDDIKMFQPTNMTYNVKSLKSETKFIDTLNSQLMDNKQKYELDTEINEDIIHDASNSFLPLGKIHSPMFKPSKSDKKCAYLLEANINKDNQIKSEFYEIQTQEQVQPKQKEALSTKFSYFDIQQKHTTLDEVPSKFIYKNGLTQDMRDQLYDDHFHSMKSLITPPTNDVVIKEIDDDKTIIQNEESDRRVKDEKEHETELYEVLESIKENLEDIPEIKAQKTHLDHTTPTDFYQQYQSYTKNEIQAEEVTLTVSDLKKAGPEAEGTGSGHDSQEDKICPSPSQLDSIVSLVSPKSLEINFEEYSDSEDYTKEMHEKESEQNDFISDVIIDDTEESSLIIQIVPNDKDIRLHQDTQFSDDSGTLKSNIRSVTVNLKLSSPSAVTNIEEESLTSMLNECVSNFIEKFRQKEYFSYLTHIESMADKDENNTTTNSAIQGTKSNEPSEYRAIKDESVRRNVIEELGEISLDYASENKTSLSSSEKPEAQFSFDETSKNPVVMKETNLTSGNFSKTKNLNDKKQKKKMGIKNYRKNSNSVLEKNNLSTKLNDRRLPDIRQSKYCTTKNVGIEIIKEIKSSSNYPLDDQYFTVISPSEIEKQARYSFENSSYQRFDSDINPDDIETNGHKLIYNEPCDETKSNLKYKKSSSNYLYAQENGREIMNLASKEVEDIELYFKTNKIQTTYTNTDEVVVIDNTEDSIKIIEKKMSELVI